ncbi:flagellar biosynthetic protein FliO [Hyphobacterium sp. SN044]|uniref:flagellar biosynthetic protein FliO n=1 Tax=Hyphobacterium sp. SN044 TaxID=2912575 RepID=UPI001F01CEA7|nr:flagellar biosynthetic protein FliO [Hyphobacterium sp. SN044]MCF8878509.1 flagellar biosynthetic protein FliO [Hyphobacterium sp. SN044]
MDVVDFAQYFAALAVVLGLLGLFALAGTQGWFTRLMNSLATKGLERTKRVRRLRVTESLVLDPRRRVVIVMIDDEEQVLLLGAGTEIVLDRRPAKSATETAS